MPRMNIVTEFVFENKQGTFRIKLDDILFFESFDHYYKIVTTSGNYEFKSTLMEIMKQISDSRFIQVHRSYVINYDNSNLVKYDEITMINGKKIPISRDRRKNVRNCVTKWEGANL